MNSIARICAIAATAVWFAGCSYTSVREPSQGSGSDARCRWMLCHEQAIVEMGVVVSVLQLAQLSSAAVDPAPDRNGTA